MLSLSAELVGLQSKKAQYKMLKKQPKINIVSHLLSGTFYKYLPVTMMRNEQTEYRISIVYDQT